MIDIEKIGNFICKLRKEQGLTQIQLAEILCIDRCAISKWERGINMPNYSSLIKLSEIFKLTINEILMGEKYSSTV